MNNIILFFDQKNRNNWGKIINLLNYKLHNELMKQFKDDFWVEIRKNEKKRSGKQLRAYWRLIRIVKNYMNEQGNFFSDDEVSNWFKLRADHFVEITEGEKIPSSIANRSDCTVEQMKKIIETIIAFGELYNIHDCYIRDEELEELLKFYQ